MDQSGLKSTLGFVPLAGALCLFEFLFPESGIINAVSVVFYILYMGIIIAKCRGIGNLQVTMTLSLLLYSFLPYLPGVDYGIFGKFNLTGAYDIYALARFATVVGNYVSSFAFAQTRREAPRQTLSDFAINRAAQLSAGISIALGLLYIARFGAVGVGSVTYAESFVQRSEPGSGVLVLAAPFAMTAAAIAFSRARLALATALPSVLAYLLFFVALGQRKYLLIPLIIFAAQRFRVRSALTISLIIPLILLGMALFGYFGYLRASGYQMSQAFDTSIGAEYLGNIGSFMSGETTTLYATAGAAYDGYIEPLPYLGDYVWSWMMSVPSRLKFINYEPANVRFSEEFTPIYAAQGGGWGFSFYGEAFLVAGFPGVFIVTTLMSFLFRAISAAAERHGRNSFFAILAVCGTYHTLWFQRNAFGYFFKEYLFQQSICILVVMVAARLLTTSSNARGARRSGIGSASLSLISNVRRR